MVIWLPAEIDMDSLILMILDLHSAVQSTVREYFQPSVPAVLIIPQKRCNQCITGCYDNTKPAFFSGLKKKNYTEVRTIFIGPFTLVSMLM